jgi:uncharacterized membrane protein
MLMWPMWVNTYLGPYSFNLSEILFLLLMRLQLGHNLTHVSFAPYIEDNNNMKSMNAMSHFEDFYQNFQILITFAIYIFIEYSEYIIRRRNELYTIDLRYL